MYGQKVKSQTRLIPGKCLGEIWLNLSKFPSRPFQEGDLNGKNVSGLVNIQTQILTDCTISSAC